MGQMQVTFETLLETQGSVAHKRLAYPKIVDIQRSGLVPAVSEIYNKLGGVLDDFELNLRSWDMEFEGLAVELDEYLHFNRYRLQTLGSPLYEDLSGFPLDEYLAHCSTKEDKCLSAGGYGGKWTSNSTERQFGPAAAKKDLSGAGAPRWRQRAFYDFVKDLSPSLIGVKVIRISVWDTILENGTERTVEKVLKSPTAASAKGLAALIFERNV